MKNEEEKMNIFWAGQRISNLYFLEYLSFADSKSLLRFFISFLEQKLQPFKREMKTAKKGQSGPTLPLIQEKYEKSEH